MILKQAFAAGLAVFLLLSAANGQKAEVTVSLNEAFFDALLDSVFRNFDPLEFAIAENRLNRGDAETRRNLIPRFESPSNTLPTGRVSAFSASPRLGGKNSLCNESVKILREMGGVRTAVRFREGKVYVPLAFSGNYAPPFVGCVEFAGWAESNIDLEYDQAGQRLIGRVRVLRVNLNGTGGVGGTVIAKMIQSSIDKKLNPIEILSLDKISFGVPIQKAGNIRMKAVGVRPEVGNTVVAIHILYEFLKG